MKTPAIYKLFLFVIAFMLVLSSCKTSRIVTVSEAKPIGTNKLLKNIEQNAFDYENFQIKRINCNFSDKKSKSTFRINVKAQKDSAILVSISKINIPVGRVLLTPQNVKYVNYIDRNYFIDDYSFLSEFLNIHLDFKTIQSIISNNAFSYRNGKKNKDFRNFEAKIENGNYVLQSEKERKIYKLQEKEKENKIERRLKRLNDNALILQKMFFNPTNFALTKLIISDKTNHRFMEMNFSDFQKVEKKDYPTQINMNFESQENQVTIRIKMNGFSTDKTNSFRLKIPEKYEEIRVN